MKPDLASLRMAAPNAPESLLEQHLRRLDDDYYERFDLAAIAAHVTQLGKLSRLLPAAVLVEPAADGQTACTLLTYDEPGLFSVATGILMSLGFSITAGAAYTYGRVPPRRTHGAETRRLVVDTFVGHVAAGPTPDWVTALEQRLRSTVGLVERRGADGLDAAQRQVNEWVTERLQQVGARRPASPFATDVAIDQLADGATRLTVESEDTPAFLYSLSAALALYGVSVRRVRIATHGQRVHDELDVELPPASEATTVREQLRIAVLLTKQFTYFLDSAADPYAALSRFGWLASHVLGGAERAEWLALLAEPRAMPSLAALLGASDFLWEDFVRPHSSELLHILQRRLHSAAEAEPPLADVLQARPTREQRAALVAYRDRQALLIQADGIFDEDPDPRPLSRRLTSLAEELLRGAIQIVTAELGPPLAVRFGVFALGKFGARALGYASDLELLLVHDGSDAQPYFGELLEGVQTLFRGKQQGLFELDLRL
ncbi:MAG TPA: hypothetical protein VFS62_13300, partial [Chloroflexota bacterium]|nr:hypothetical protein [Chloroflexota bacterium]